ncbi:winged helix-turn-helix domain-containing protein [Vibrio coralliilyticus]|uniref:winged helix-turn-helix domain-containing protein n=1 Tax=Vibrio coralliilyticus TaxID=190893 RepID=UPI00156169E1|nr:winged helix-turn-helix domain-containing protein [Vibrio coralliilyticus]NRF12898.1 winged helix-turn-helix domain-containing protein [Vibrio coralliilyticus]
MSDIIVYKSNRKIVCKSSGKEVVLRPKPYKVFLLLLENKGMCVSKNDIFDSCWPNVVVSDQSLTNTIGVIRRALEELDTKNVNLSTISKSGYILTANDVEVIDASAPEKVFNESSLKVGNVEDEKISVESEVINKELSRISLKAPLISYTLTRFLLFIIICLLAYFYIMNSQSDGPYYMDEDQYNSFKLKSTVFHLHDEKNVLDIDNFKSILDNYDFSNCDYSSVYIRVYRSALSRKNASSSMFLVRNNGEVSNVVLHVLPLDNEMVEISKILKSKGICDF